MSKVKIRLITIGHMPPRIDFAKIRRWKSDLLELSGPIDNYSLRCDSDGPSWEYSDELLKQQFPPSNTGEYSFTVAIVNVPIEDNWFSRRIGDGEIVFTFYQIREVLESKNIPLENAILRLLYSYALIYIRNGNRIPDYSEGPIFTHDETRGCLFDMNGSKGDIIESCHRPILCNECEERLSNGRVASSSITSAKREIHKIRKPIYYMALDFVKAKPLWALMISSIYAILIGVISTFISTYLENTSVQPPSKAITSRFSGR